MFRKYFFALLLISFWAAVSLSQSIQYWTPDRGKNIQINSLPTKLELYRKEDCEDKLNKVQLEPAEQTKIKAAIKRQISSYLKQFENTHFGKAISIGDPKIFESKIDESMNLIYTDSNGSCLISKYSPKAKSYHYSWKLIGRSADLVFPFDPTSTITNTQQQTLMHEMTHHIEWLNGVKQSSTEWIIWENPASERNTNYQDFVVNALIQWKKTEDLINVKNENLPGAIQEWKSLEATLADLEKGTAAGGTPPDKNLKAMNGFNVKFEDIKQKYLSGSAGEDLKNFVMLADLLPKMDANLDLYRDSAPFGRDQTAELTEGEQLNISATVVKNSVDMELDPKLKAQFYWTAAGLATQTGKTFKFTAGKGSSFYMVTVDLRIPFNDREYSIATAAFKISTKPKEDNSAKAGKISIKAPKEVLVTDIIDAEAVIPPALQTKMKDSYWYPGNCGTTQNATSGKLQFTNPRLEKPYKDIITFNAQDENKNTFASAQAEVLVKPAFFSGSASDVWKGGGNSSGFGIERQPAIRKRMENGGEINSATVSGYANIGWDLSSAFKTPEDIEKELLKDQENRKDFVITAVDIAGFKGFALEQKQPQYSFRGTGYVDAGRPATAMSGYGYAIKGCLVIRFSYSSEGSGFMLGEGTGRGDPAAAWWNDTAFLISQTKAAATEAKSILLGLSLAPDSTLATTPYKGPKLDGSDLPRVKLAILPDNNKLKKGDIVNVRAVIENEENAEKPLQFAWTGEHIGNGQSVKFIADKAGKQSLTVSVRGIGAASIEFEVAPVKAEIVRVSPTSAKISAGTPVLFSARLLSGDNEINGNYIYRWQPQREAKFEPSEGTGKQTKAIFSKEGRTGVWVQILERKGEVLETVAESQPIEIEIVAAAQKPTNNPNTTVETTSKVSLSTAKLTEAKTVIKKGKLDEAIVSVDEAVKLNPKNAEAVKLSKKWKKELTTINAQLTKVKILTEQGKFDEAEKELLVAQNLHILYKPVFDADLELKAKRAKNNSAVTEGLGQVRLANEARKFKQALELIRELRRNYILNSFAVSELKRYEDWAQFHETEKNRQRAIMLEGEAKFNAYDYEGAIKDFDVLWVNHYVYWGMYDPEPKKYGDLRNEAIVRRDRINKLMSEISTVANDKSFDKRIIQNALTNIDEVLQLQPTNALAREYKTFLTDRLGRGEKGAKHDEAINKGTEFYNSQKYGDAIKEYDKAIKADPRSSEAYRGRAMAKHENGDLKGSLKDYDKAIELNPTNSHAFLGRGAVRDKLGETNGALSDFTRGIEIDPNNPRGYEFRGGFKTNQQDYQGAFSDFDKVVILEPTNSYAYNNRGYVKEQLGDIKGALKDYEKAISLDSSNELAKNNSAKLKEKLADAAKVADPPVQSDSPETTNTDLSSWSGEWNTNDNGYKLYLTQTGNRVSGTYPFDEGRIEGRVVGNKLIGTWSEAPTYKPNRDAGDIEFTMSADGKSFSGKWRYGSNQEWSTNPWNGTRANAAAVNKPTQANTIPTGKEVEIFTSMNIYGVQNKPTAQTTFTIAKPHVITYMMTYHWNNGEGTSQPGYIGIHNSKGETFKPWQTTGTPGQGGVPNAGWEAFPNIILPAGTYTIVDSDPATWSQNSQSGGRGMAIVKGYPTGGTNQPPSVTNTTPIKQPPTTSTQETFVVAVIQNRSGENVHIFSEGDTFGTQNRIAPNETKQVNLKMPANGRIKFYAGRNGQVITTKIWNGDPSDPNRYPKVIFDGTQLLITTGLR